MEGDAMYRIEMWPLIFLRAMSSRVLPQKSRSCATTLKHGTWRVTASCCLSMILRHGGVAKYLPPCTGIIGVRSISQSVNY